MFSGIGGKAPGVSTGNAMSEWRERQAFLSHERSQAVRCEGCGAPLTSFVCSYCTGGSDDD